MSISLHTQKYNKCIEIAAFLRTQTSLNVAPEDINAVLPALKAAHTNNSELAREIDPIFSREWGRQSL
jgi:hypothetical protein